MKYLQLYCPVFALLLLSACSGGQTNTASSSADKDKVPAQSTLTSNGSDSSADQSSDGVVVLLSVGPALAPCTGIIETQCLLVKRPGEDQWTFFYDPIEGFDFQPGYNWTLEVRRTEVKNPPADGSSARWELIRIVEQVMERSTLRQLTVEDVEVAGALVQCKSSTGLDDTCLRIRTLGSQTWSVWPNTIEGYRHTAGIASTLRVRNSPWGQHSAAEATSPYRRELLSVLSSQSS